MSDAQLPTDAPPDWEMIARYHAGESPAAEAHAVEAWLASHPADAGMLATLRDASARAVAPAPLGDVDVEAALARARARRREAGAPTVLPLRSRTAPARTRGVWWIGGLAVAAAAAFAVVEVQRDRGPAATAVPDGVALLAPGSERATVVAQRDSVRLADGSHVVLAPGSRLAVSPDFGRATRDVTLEGAAVFTVRHDEARPFTVHAGGAIVRDMGTTFAVRTDDGARGVSVVVTEGVVALRAASSRDTGLVLRAGDGGSVRADGAVTVARASVTADDLAWTQGRLVYRDVPLDVVRADLQRWYGIELRVDPALAGRRLTASFAGESADRVLAVIALALGAQVERQGNVATLRPTRAAVR